MPESIPEVANHKQSANCLEETPPRARYRWAWIVGTCLILLGGVAFFLQSRSAGASSHSKPPFSPPALAVATVAARKGDIGIYVNALGAVTPVYTVAVKSRVDGQLMRVNYEEGQTVHKGDSLVEIDPRPYQAQLTQFEGQYARDQALLENAHVDLDRYQTAFAKNAIPKQTLDTQVATVHQYEGTVKLDEGLVENAQVQLAYCHVTSPISGHVGLRLVDPGNIVHAADTNPLLVITELQPITVIFSVAEDHLPEIQQQLVRGMKLSVEALDRAQQKKIATGALLTLDNQIDPGTGTVKLKALFPNSDNALFPGQFVNARLLVSTQTNATLLPTQTIQRSAEGAFVYVLTPEQTVGMRAVSVGATDGNLSAVEGVEPGAVVAADNFNRLQEGTKVVARKPVHEGNPGNGQTAASDGERHTL